MTEAVLLYLTVGAGVAIYSRPTATQGRTPRPGISTAAMVVVTLAWPAILAVVAVLYRRMR